MCPLQPQDFIVYVASICKETPEPEVTTGRWEARFFKQCPGLTMAEIFVHNRLQDSMIFF